MTKTIAFEEDELELLRRHVDYLIEQEEAEFKSLQQHMYKAHAGQEESRKRFRQQSEEMMKLLQKIRSKL